MKNSNYWQDRFKQLEEAQHEWGAKAFGEMEKQYREAQKELEAAIDKWYRRFAENNNISMAEARKWLTGKDLKEFKWSVEEYIAYGEEHAISGRWAKELENASAKYHISRLEALKIQTQQALERLFTSQNKTITDTLNDVFRTGYYRTAFELQKGFEIGFDIVRIDNDYLAKVLAKPWAVDGKNFSDRIWDNKEKLINELHTELSRNIITGADPQKAIDAISHKLDVSKANAGRLVMTEEAYFSSLAQKECFEDLDVEEYEIVATLDNRTSEICQEMDGQHFPMKDFEAGVTAPPFHVNCRSTTRPYFNDEFSLGERAARDENGEVYYVPSDMTYPEWKEAFVDGGSKEKFVMLDDYAEPPEPPESKFDTETREFIYDPEEDRLIEITANNTSGNAEKNASLDNKPIDKKPINIEPKTTGNIDVGAKKEYNKNEAKSSRSQEEVKPYLQKKLNYIWDDKEDFIPQGAEFDVVVTIAGAGTDKELRIVEDLINQHGGTADVWKKKVGKITSDKYIFDVHWYEREDGIQYEEKVKYRKGRKK